MGVYKPKCSLFMKGILKIFLDSLCSIYQARVKPVAFHKLRSYHNRALWLNWGPENVHFEKTHFRNPNINASIFLCGKFKELPGATLFCFAFFNTKPKNSPKNKVKKMPKNNQNHFATSQRSSIRTKARETFLF